MSSHLTRKRLCLCRNNTDELAANLDHDWSGMEDRDGVSAPVIRCHKFKLEALPTEKIGEVLEIKDLQGVSSIIVGQVLQPITELTGDELLHAWWHAVVSHQKLWKHGVHHCEINTTNLKYHRNSTGEVIGVFNDFDLSSMENISGDRERAGAPLFMAMSFLRYHAMCVNLKGEQPVHKYWHDAESFIWVLFWVSHRCDEYRNSLMHARYAYFLGDWLYFTPIGCFHSKESCLSESVEVQIIESSHIPPWKIAECCLHIVYKSNKQHLEKMDDGVDYVFQNWFYTQVPSSLQEEYSLVH